MDIDLMAGATRDVTSAPIAQGFDKPKIVNYNSFLGIDLTNLRGKAYKEEDTAVSDYEKEVKAGKFKTLFPLSKALDCGAYQLMLNQIDTEDASLRRHAQTAKPAFRARWDKLSGQLRDHRAQLERANASLKCDEVAAAKDRAQQQADLQDALSVAAATKGLLQSQDKTGNLPLILIGLGSVAVIGFFAYMITRSKPALKPAS